MNKLGKLQRVNLRDVWQHEANDFTPWLAQEENLALLGETLSLELELEGQEENVGPFKADILCKDTLTGSFVLIENQLERTDHSHLGQLITYAAGLEAVTIVWIADRFTDEHRAALDWLNEISDDSAHFFGLEVELWRIGDSPIAPKFNIISKPNEWTKAVAMNVKSGGLTEGQSFNLKFWTGLSDYILEIESSIKPITPYKDNWRDISIGRTGFFLRAFISAMYDRVGVGLIINNPQGKEYFSILEQEKTNIEDLIGAELDWRLLPDNKESQILLMKFDIGITNEVNWKSIFNWVIVNLESFDRVFRPKVKSLSLEELEDA